MTGTLETSRLSWKTRLLMVRSISGMKTAAGSRMKTATAQAKVREEPRRPEWRASRRAILARLMSGQAGVTELAKPFDMSLPAISKHLKVLERAGLIARGRDAQWRPCRLDAGPLKEVADWVGHYRQFWEESFDRLDEY